MHHPPLTGVENELDGDGGATVVAVAEPTGAGATELVGARATELVGAGATELVGAGATELVGAGATKLVGAGAAGVAIVVIGPAGPWP